MRIRGYGCYGCERKLNKDMGRARGDPRAFLMPADTAKGAEHDKQIKGKIWRK